MSAPAVPPPVAAPVVLIACLIALSAIGPMSIQIFLPAMPFIMKEFGVGVGLGQLTVTIALVITGIATLFFGPLADRYGRKRIVQATLVLFAASSGVCALAQDIETLIAVRNAQALGASAGVVLARAVAADVWGRGKAATILSYLTMAMGLSTMLTPSLGGVLCDLFGWRAPFAFCVALGIGLLILARAGIPPDQGPADTGASGIMPVLKAGGRLFVSPIFGAFAVGSSLNVSTFFSFVTVAPYLVVDGMGLSATDFGLWFMLMPGGFVTGSLISSRVGARIGAARMSALGSGVAAAGATSLAILLSTQPLSMPILFLPAMAIGLGNGLSLPNAQAGALAVEPRISGTASGVVGFSQNFFAAVASQTVAYFFDGSTGVVMIAVLACAFGGLACGLASVRLAAKTGTASPKSSSLPP